MTLYYLDIETAAEKRRYEEYVENRRRYDMSLRPAKNEEERLAMHSAGPKMVHGDKPARDKIVSIQFWKLDDIAEGEFAPLVMLKEWELGGEKAMLDEFERRTKFFQRKWDAVPVGFNLNFDLKFLRVKAERFGHLKIDLANPVGWEKPCIDLHHIAMLFNADNVHPPGVRGDVPAMMLGASLDRFSRKRGKGSAVTKLYYEKRYSAIEMYAKQEAESFVELWKILKVEMPKLWKSVVGPQVGQAVGATSRVSQRIADRLAAGAVGDGAGSGG